MQKEHSQRTDESKSVNKNLSTAENKGEQEQENHEDPGSSRQLLLEYMHLDLSSLNSTVEFVEAFRKTGYPLHVLICNAGIAFANQGVCWNRLSVITSNVWYVSFENFYNLYL